MRLLPILTLCSASLLLPGLSIAKDQAAHGAVRDVREAERQRAQALNERDIDVLRRLIGGNYHHVETNGRLRTKTEFLQALARDEYRIRHYEIEDMEIEVADSGELAVVTGTYRAARLDLAASQPLRGRYVRVWTRRPEGWRVAVHQGTEVRTVAAQPPLRDSRALQ